MWKAFGEIEVGLAVDMISLTRRSGIAGISGAAVRYLSSLISRCDKPTLSAHDCLGLYRYTTEL